MKFADALQLPKGTYYTPKMARINPEEAALVNKWGTAKTNAGSDVPVIGAAAVNPHAAVILYNRKTRTAVLTHTACPDDKCFELLLRQVRKNETDRVEVHVFGMAIAAKNDPDSQSINETVVSYLTSFLDAMAEAKNVTLKTFDVYHKPHPRAVAIDTRNGNIIMGSKLFITEGKGKRISDRLDGWHVKADKCNNYDGTVAWLQKHR